MKDKLSVQIQKNTFLRKSYWSVRQISREIHRRRSSLEDYQRCRPILVNSFPKSGTHLLLQILQAVPWVTYYSSFIASMPPMPHKERSQTNHLKHLQKIAPGEVIPGHLFYHPAYHQELSRRQVIILFIYRDPRDVTISEAYYLTHMTRWHGLHNYFANSLTTMEERISASILGASEHGFPYSYPDIAQRFQRYREWLNCQDVFQVKFEELVGTQQEKTVKHIAEFLVTTGDPNLDANWLAKRLLANIAPQDSRTFRKGQAEQWRTTYTAVQKEQFKSVAGDLLIDLGYEQDLNW